MKRFSKITTTQLARICGVSQGTVDRALHDRGGINQRTKDRILEVAREYDYIPSIHGEEQTSSMLIGVVLYDLYNEFFSKLAMSMVNAAKQFGLSIIFQFSEKDGKSEKLALEYFDYIGVDGIILFSVGSDEDEYENYLKSIKKPLVLIGNKMFDLPFIGIDDSRAMYDLTERIVGDTDCREIVYYAPVLRRELHSLNAQRLRLGGFIDAATSHGLTSRVATSLDELSDAGVIVCATDSYAIEVMKHFDFSQNISVSGFDNISYLKHIKKRVLTVDYSTDSIAKACVDYILGRRYTSRIEHKILYNTD